MKAIIIDDEKPARENLISLLRKVADDVNVIGEADSVDSGIKILSKLKPDLVFLDINLADGSGFNILEQVSCDFQTIFVTAYDSFAVRAFKVNALDYILKAIDEDELMAALAKARKRIKLQENIPEFKWIAKNWNRAPANQKLVVKERGSIRYIDIIDIVRCQADNNYTTIYLLSGEKIITPRTLKEFTEILESFNFFRIHQSHLVNIRFITRVNHEDSGGSVETKFGDVLRLSRLNKEAFMQKMKEISHYK